MKIIDSIKKVCKEKGISEKYAERIQKGFKVEKEEDVSGAVDLFKENILPAITEAEETAKKDAEKASKKLAIEEYEKKFGLKEGKPINPEPTDPKPTDPTKSDPTPSDPAPAGNPKVELDPAVKAIIDAQNKQMEEMRKLIEGSQKSAANAEKTSIAKTLLAKAELPEGWVNRINVESEISIEDQIKALSEEYTGIQQKIIDAKVASGEYTPHDVHYAERSEKEWVDVMNSGSDSKAAGIAPLE